MAEFFPSQAPQLSMRAVDKRFNGVPALVAASLEVGRNEIHALIGQNGAGKSTMIKILTGYYSRDAGEIFLMVLRCTLIHQSPRKGAGSVPFIKRSTSSRTDR
jgi:ABC-type sugar transport system ATPase subunit